MDGTMDTKRPRDAERAEFGKRLRALMLNKGWNQSELSRRAQEKLPDGSERRLGRDIVSLYIRGKAMPGPIHLAALAQALDVTPGDLIAGGGEPPPSMAPKFAMRQIDGDPDSVLLQVNQRVSMDAALAIANLLRDDK